MISTWERNIPIHKKGAHLHFTPKNFKSMRLNSKKPSIVDEFEDWLPNVLDFVGSFLLKTRCVLT